MIPILTVALLGYIALAMARVPKELESRTEEHVHPIASYLLGGLIPGVILTVLVYIFLIRGAGTMVQLNVGSESRMNMWSAWVDLFIPCFFLSGAGAVGYLITSLVYLAKKDRRKALPRTAFAMILHGCAWFTVILYAPSA